MSCGESKGLALGTERFGHRQKKKNTSSRETELISAAKDSEKAVENRLLAPWMLRVMICPFSSSFCSFRLRLS